MPNGLDKNYVRLCAALDGFFARHGRWPTRVVAFRGALEDLRLNVLGPAAYGRVTRRVALVPGEAGFRAEDDTGASYDYGAEGFAPRDLRPVPGAREWLGESMLPDSH